MDRMFQMLEAVMNQTSIGQFRAFLARYPDVTKWMLVSDYCLDDKTKPNRVVSFVLYPYILDFDQWNALIKGMQKTDLKKCRTVSPEFCTFAQSGAFFSFNFILDKHCILEKWNDPAALNRLLADCIELLEQWSNTTPQNADTYRAAKAQFERVQRHTQQKNFNNKLLGRVVEITFLAGYLRYLLYRETKRVEVFSWLSDRDNITSWEEGIYRELYWLISRGIAGEHLPPEKADSGREITLTDPEECKEFDPMLRVADFICGGLADYRMQDDLVSGQKQQTLLRDVIAENPYLVVLRVKEQGIARGVYQKTPEPQR